MHSTCRLSLIGLVFLLFGWAGSPCAGQPERRIFLPPADHVQIRDPNRLPSFPIPSQSAPPTVSFPLGDLPDQFLTLDDAIRISLENSEVVRFLGGVTASSSGRTIYDVPQQLTAVDVQRGRFDPNLTFNNSVSQNEPTGGLFDTTAFVFPGEQSERYSMDFSISKISQWGATTTFRTNTNPTNFSFGGRLLNPQNRSFTDITITQPLLQGGGWRANLAPIVIASIDTERSFFQFKDSMQELVRSTIDAYWSLVFARTDQWARERQVEQAKFALDLTRARRDADLANQGDVAQAEVALYNFQATLLSSRANVFQREEALRNVMGLPPTDGVRLVPVTPPLIDPVRPEWEELITLAERNRPDVIELKLILEADEQLLIQAENQARPSLDAVAQYRWNGLNGTIPGTGFVSTRPGEFTDWNLGINFSVPLGLRQSRASLRQTELLISRDRANLQQGIHAMVHQVAFNYRNVDLLYSQYDLFRQTRQSARTNLESQLARYRAQLVIFLNVLLAINDWGNAVSSEAQALTQYNTELANLERQTGTILESHGIRFVEERFGFVGPLKRGDRWYPARVTPTLNYERYPAGDKPSEENFDLSTPQIPSEQVQPDVNVPDPLRLDFAEPQRLPPPPVESAGPRWQPPWLDHDSSRRRR